MRFAPNPGILAAGVQTGKTYADFVAWAATQGASSVLDGDVPSSVGAGLKIFTLGNSFDYSMFGSPWGGGPSGGRFYSTARFSRIAQHSFASLASANANLGRIVLSSVSAAGFLDGVFGLDRNGFLSGSLPFDPELYDVWTSDRFDYFNDETGRRVRVNPLLQTVQEFDL